MGKAVALKKNVSFAVSPVVHEIPRNSKRPGALRKISAVLRRNKSGGGSIKKKKQSKQSDVVSPLKSKSKNKPLLKCVSSLAAGSRDSDAQAQDCQTIEKTLARLSEIDGKTVKTNMKKSGMSKKDKMKLKKSSFVQKISLGKHLERLKKEESKRKKTKIVGDLNPLLDSLPTIDGDSTDRRPIKSKGAKIKRPKSTQIRVTNIRQKNNASGKIAKSKKQLSEKKTKFKTLSNKTLRDIRQFQQTMSQWRTIESDPMQAILEHFEERIRAET